MQGEESKGREQGTGDGINNGGLRDNEQGCLGLGIVASGSGPIAANKCGGLVVNIQSRLGSLTDMPFLLSGETSGRVLK